jgi:hypothetical protein
VKNKDIFGISLSESMLGGNSSRYDITNSNGKFEAYLKMTDRSTPVAMLKIEDGVIMELTVDEEEEKYKSDVFTAMIKAACKDADRTNSPLVVPANAMVGGLKAIRFMQSFGFMKNEEYLERRPGSSLPYSVLF